MRTVASRPTTWTRPTWRRPLGSPGQAYRLGWQVAEADRLPGKAGVTGHGPEASKDAPGDPDRPANDRADSQPVSLVEIGPDVVVTRDAGRDHSSVIRISSSPVSTWRPTVGEHLGDAAGALGVEGRLHLHRLDREQLLPLADRRRPG